MERIAAGKYYKCLNPSWETLSALTESLEFLAVKILWSLSALTESLEFLAVKIEW